MSENAKINILDAYWAYFNASNTLRACKEALETCGLPKEDPEYKKLEDARSEAYKALEIAWDNFDAIYDWIFR